MKPSTKICVGDMIEVVYSPYSHVLPGMKGTITHIFERGVAAKFEGVTHPMVGSSSASKDFQTPQTVEVWLSHSGEYKLYDPNKTTGPQAV